ncbi:MAG: hypothetical protein Ct9H300mP14_15010 [Gammaproteobacteria bacterium]|nr:MAG: hypothetical protein Ct9H300mP14_15010 [Gammaproteobacteria bacterium]
MRLPLREADDSVWGGRQPTFKNDEQKFGLSGWSKNVGLHPSGQSNTAAVGVKSRGKNSTRGDENYFSPPALMSFGIWMLGPALLKYGTEAQKQTHLPPITRGEIRWAQGYSEPNSGSDLASLSTRCEQNGDHYLINGQKIWTSFGHKGDWILSWYGRILRLETCGISLVLVDMAQPGVTTRPIKLLSVHPISVRHFSKTRAVN